MASRASKLVPLLLCALFAALAWNAYADPPLRAGARAVVGAFAALTALSAVAGFTGPALRARLVLAVLSTALALAAVEAAARTVGPHAIRDLPDDFDRRAYEEVILDLRADGVPAVGTFHPASYLQPTEIGGEVTIPFGGISLATTVHCNETGEYVVFESDEHGFNNPRGTWSLEPPLQVALVGDSFTMGACVAVEDQYASLIRARYPATINLGSDGSGPLIELAVLTEYLPDLRPEVVLWCYYEGNDLRELNREKSNELLLAYLEGDFTQELRPRQEELDAFLGETQDRLLTERAGRPFLTRGFFIDRERRWSSKLRLSATQRTIEHSLSGTPGESVPADLALLARVIATARDRVAAWGGRLYFVYLPEHAVVKGGGVHAWREEVLAVVADEGVPIVDVHAAFAREEDPLSFFPYRRPGHYVAAGAAIVAREALAAIEDEL